MKDEKQAEDFLRAKGLTGDFKTKRILTPEQGTLVEWFVEFANQQPTKTVEERAKELYPELSSKEETYLRNNVDMQIQREAYIKGAMEHKNK